MFRIVTLVLCVLHSHIAKAKYEVPDVTFEALTPRGFRVSIPDEEGISLFAFHGKVNEELNGREGGRFSVDIIKPKNGRWVYLTKDVRLKVGDIIYYWVYVDYDDGYAKLGYTKDDQMFKVTGFVRETDPIGTPTNTTRRPPETDTTAGNTECKSTSTMVNGKPTCQGALIFHDDFQTFARKKWTPEIKFAGDPDYEFVVYQDNAENLGVHENRLHIKPTLLENRYGSGFATHPDGLDLGAECTGVPESFSCVQKPRAWQILPPVLSAQITTKNHFTFLYGSVEIKAKFPKGDWIYPELYLKSRSDVYGSGLDSGLIRIAFTPGNTDSSKALSGGCVLGQSVFARNYGIKTIISEKSWTNEFHIFRIDWKPDSITLSVDDHVYGNIYPPEEGFASQEKQLKIEPDTAERWRRGSPMAPFDKEMYLSLGVGVGGWCIPDREDDSKPWTNFEPKAQLSFYRSQDTWNRTWNEHSKLLVDYVKIWAL